MALAKENPAQSNQLEDFVSSSSEPSSQSAPLERLLNLLVDLSSIDQTSAPPIELPASKEQAEVVEGLSEEQEKPLWLCEPQSHAPCHEILAGREKKEDLVFPSNELNPQQVVLSADRAEDLAVSNSAKSSILPVDLPTTPNSSKQPVPLLDGLLNLLVDLQIAEPNQNLSPADGILVDTNRNENLVSPSSKPNPQTATLVVTQDWGNSWFPLEIKGQQRWKNGEMTADDGSSQLITPHPDFPTSPLGEELPTFPESCTCSVAQPDSRLNLQVDLHVNQIEKSPFELLPSKAEVGVVNTKLHSSFAAVASLTEVLRTGTAWEEGRQGDREERASVKYLPPAPISNPSSLPNEKVTQLAATLSEDWENPLPPSHLLEEQVEEPSEQSISGTADPDNLNSSESPLERLRTLLLTPELAESQQMIANLKQKLANLERQIYEPSELINLLLPLITELLSLKIAESKEKVVEAIAPIIDQMIQSRTEQNKAAMSAALAPVLSTAITQQIANVRGEIATALGPAMAGAIKEQISVEREAMVDALYPVIGSTISKYMVEEIRAINEKIENTFSVEGISRKVRAKMQGVSEAELILKEAMPFTVQAVFLIHKASGLVISEVQPSNQKLESEMVAGMLTAIRSFVNDCIAQSGNISELDEIDYGNSKIVLEVAGYCYLAVVVQGEPPQWFIRNLRRTLSTIVQSYGRSINLFDGNPATIPAQVQPTLEALMLANSKEQAKKPPALLIVGSVLLSLTLLPWGIYQYRHGIDRRVEADTAFALASAPDLAVYRLNVAAREGILKLSGKLPNEYLRQRAEKIARGVTPNWKLDNSIVAVDVPPDPVLAAAEVKRVTSMMNQIEGSAITTQYAAGAVTIEGTVKRDADARKITQAIKQIPGVYSVTNTVQPQQPRIAIRIYFTPSSAELKPADTDQIIQIKTFLNRYRATHIRIVGHSDPIGNFVQNQQLALKRAEVVRDALIGQGIEPKRLQVVGTITAPFDVSANQSLLFSRCVEFEVITTDTQSQ